MNENKANRLTGEIARMQKNAAGLEKKIDDKTTELHAAMQGLAKEQGVSVASFDDLLGDFWPEEEGPEEFASALTEWREDCSRNIP